MKEKEERETNMDPLPDRRSTTSSMGCYYSTVSSYTSFTTVEWYPPDEQAAPPPPPPTKSPQKVYHPFESNRVSKSFGCTWQKPDKLAELVSESADSERFARLVLAMLVSLIISLSMASLVLWVLFGVDLPLFEVGALSASKFTVTKSVIKATWRVNVTVTNPNSEFKLSDDLLNATILYNDHPLAMASILPVYQQVDDNNADGLQQAYLFLELDNSMMWVYSREQIVEEVVKSLETGVLPVSLSIVVGSKFVSNENDRGWSQDTLKIYCGDLKILISRNGDGHLAEESTGKQCLTFA